MDGFRAVARDRASSQCPVHRPHAHRTLGRRGRPLSYGSAPFFIWFLRHHAFELSRSAPPRDQCRWIVVGPAVAPCVTILVKQPGPHEVPASALAEAENTAGPPWNGGPPGFASTVIG